MLKNKGVRASAGILLLVIGALLTFQASRRYTEKRYIVDAGPCRLDVNLTERADLAPASEHAAVVLFHGISANKVIMQYLARSFAEMGMRVYTPDAAGHGRSPGPFTPAMAEACSLSLVRGLAARGLIDPDHTILAGHSMGGAIAIRVAGKFRPAGVVAISPAPMVAAHGVTAENLLFQDRPPLTPNSLVMAGQFEPVGLVANAADLVAGSLDPTARFERVNWNSHVSVLFSPTVARESQKWAARILKLTNEEGLPSRANLLGGLLGLLGILLLAGPFIREMVGKQPVEEPCPTNLPSAARMVVECTVASFSAIFLLHYWLPLRFVKLFEGDYLASFFLVVGGALLLLHPRTAKAQLPVKSRLLFGAAFAALVLHLLITGWFELTITGSWLTANRWARFPAFALAAFVFLFALESLLAPATLSRYRTVQALCLVALCWSALVASVLFFKSGEILLVLLSPFFALCILFTYMGAQLVRRLTASATAAALFGAILITGFCLVLFPLS